MRRLWWSTMVVVAVGVAACGGDGRPEPKAGEAVVVETFDLEFLPRGVAVDREGTVYTSGWDPDEDRFVMAAFSADGKEERFPIPCATDEAASEALYGSVAVTPDGETLFWSMDEQNRVARLDRDGEGDCFAGTGEEGFSGDGGPADQAKLDDVTGLAYDPGEEALYIADAGNLRVRKVDADGVITTVVGPEGMTGERPVRSVDMAFDAGRGRLYVKELAGIAYRDRNGEVHLIPRSNGSVFSSAGLAPDPTGEDLVTSLGDCDVVRISDNGEVEVVVALDEGMCSYQLVVDAKGDIWLLAGAELIVVRPAG